MTKYDMGYEDCECKKSQGKGGSMIRLSCGNGHGIVLPINNVGCCSQTSPLVIGSVSVDTCGMKKPCIKIDFSSLISFRSDCDPCSPGYFIRLFFRLVRVCENGCPIALESWNYEMSSESTFMDSALAGNVSGDGTAAGFFPFKSEVVAVTDSFAFTWCSCQEFSGSCEYFVELTDIQTCNIDFAAVSTVGINAMAVGC